MSSLRNKVGEATAADNDNVCRLCKCYLDSPKDLPCRHSFCRSCLSEFCLNNATKDGFPCPHCEKLVKVPDLNLPLMEWVDVIPTNMSTHQKLEKIRKLEEQKHIKVCTLCAVKRKPIMADKYCKACEEYFCTECGNQHWLLRRSKQHRVWFVEDLKALKADPLLQSTCAIVSSARIRKAHINLHARRNKECNNKQLTEDSMDCEIAGATFLPDGSFALVDTANVKIKVFNKHLHPIASYSTHCHEVLSFNKCFFVVSSPQERCLKLFSYFNKIIEMEQTVDLVGEGYGLCYTDNEFDTNNFAVAVKSQPVQILLFSGMIQTHSVNVRTNEVAIICPEYLTFVKTKHVFIISDRSSSSLVCVNQDGESVWEKNIPECLGLACFHENILVARGDRQSVDIVSINGQIMKSVVSSNDGICHVRALCREYWKPAYSKTRILVGDDTDLIRILSLEDPLLDEDIGQFMGQNQNSENDRGRLDTSAMFSSLTCSLL